MKIAIVGAHRHTKLRAPYSDPKWQIWACSAFNESELPRVDVWYELHDPKDPNSYVSGAMDGGVYRRFLSTLPKVFLREELADIPGGVKYDLDRVTERFGDRFLTGTISFMMADAILSDATQIGLWGISNCPEYATQKPSIQYFLTEAERAGIVVTSDPPEIVERPPIYAFEAP